MRVGIDIRRSGEYGVGIYIRNLVRSLGRVGPEHEFVVIGRREHLQEFGELPPNFGFEPYDRRFDAAVSHMTYGSGLAGLALDVLHMPHRWVPMSAPRPYVVTLHDINTVLFPGEADGVRLKRIRDSLLVRGLRRAAVTMAVSEATKRDAILRLKLPADRFQVVYQAVDEEVATPVHDDERNRVLERYSIEDPFVLYAGRIQPHKNVPRLIEAFAVARSQVEQDWRYRNLKLVVIGDDLSRYPEVRRSVMRTRIQDSVRFLGFVPVETLRVFYASASVFLFPSLYEGFGMPPLEAMAHGTPVVTSNTSSIPEAVGDAAVSVNPENVFDIARGLRQVLTGEVDNGELVERGFKQVKRFSWDQTAEQVISVYRRALTGLAGPA